MSEAVLDISSYVTAPIVDVASGVALGVALLSSLPKSAPKPVRRAARGVRTSTLALQSAWKATLAQADEVVDRRAADHRMDVAWNATWNRLHAYAALPADEYPKAAKATQLLGDVFPDGLTFLKLPYTREWAESDRRLRLLADKKTESELRHLVGDDFVDELKKAHAAYGDALHITEAQAPADVVGVQDPLRALQSSVRDYALQVVAAANDDASFAEAARTALGPIDWMRDEASRAASSNGGASANAAAPPNPSADAPAPAATSPVPPVTPDSPLPPVPET